MLSFQLQPSILTCKLSDTNHNLRYKNLDFTLGSVLVNKILSQIVCGKIVVQIS